MKSQRNHLGKQRVQSRPARGAWIEISNGSELRKNLLVAPRMGRVD